MACAPPRDRHAVFIDRVTHCARNRFVDARVFCVDVPFNDTTSARRDEYCDGYSVVPPDCGVVSSGRLSQYGARARAMVASKLRADLAEARLATLEGQLHPHFVFNALNSVAALMRIDPSQAEVMIEQLSELLRATLRTNPMHQVPLRDAVHIAEQYLAIEHVRFQARLTTQVRVADDAQHALLPQLLLQPLVENAVRHGIAPLENGGEVRISATVTSQTLHIAIEDTGVGISAAPSAHTGNGLGMRSVRAMLSQLYGERGTLLVAPIVPHGTRVMISLPYTITRS